MTEPVSPPKDSEDPPRIHPWRWITALAVTAFLLVLGGMAWNLFVDVPLRISAETTYVTAPLTADGQWVDYVAALELRRYPPEMQTDDNGARLIVRATGAGPDMTPEATQQIYRKLGLEPSTLPVLTYEEPWVYLKQYVTSQRALGAIAADKSDSDVAGAWDNQLAHPWTLQDLPMMKAWLDDNSPALDLAIEAGRCPEFCFPFVRSENPATESLHGIHQITRIRAFTRGHAARAWHRIAIGDLDGAMYDKMTIARQGRLLQTSGILIESLIGLALEAVANSIGIAATDDHPPDAEQLQRLMGELNQLTPREPFDALLQSERHLLLHTVQRLAQGDWSSAENEWKSMPLFPELGMKGHQIGFDWNVVFRRINANYEEMLLGRTSLGPPPEWQAPLRTSRSLQLADRMSRAFIAPMSQVREAIHRGECQEHLQRIALAMLLYERRNGTLPPAYTVDAAGNRRHSWRVLLLPYLGEAELFSKIRLDEPWDSPHNRAFHAAAVHVYQCPSHTLAPGETTYAVVDGSGAPFDGPVGRSLKDLGLERAGLVLVAERTVAANWMDPRQEVPLAQAKLGINQHGLAGIGLGSPHAGGMQVGLLSGGTEFLSENIDDSELARRLDALAPPADLPLEEPAEEM
jgi:hypothetical protein